MGRLLTIGNAKTVKGQKRGFLTGILHLAPADLSGKNVCPWSTAGCRASCLNTSGRGVYQDTQNARIRKTKEFTEDKVDFMVQLHDDISALVRKAAREDLTPCVRLDGTSDLGLSIQVAKSFPDVQFYDYTKSFKRMSDFLRGNLPDNVHFTFSRSEGNEADCKFILEQGGNVAVVFGGERPTQFMGHEVVDGDHDDCRFLDQGTLGKIIALTPRGRARRDQTGFVIRD